MTRGSSRDTAAQLPLGFDSAANGPDLVRTPAAEAAMAALAQWRNWPDGQLAVIGGGSSGKTRLLHDWCVRSGAWATSGDVLAAADIREVHAKSQSGVAIDDADMSPNGEHLLAAINFCRDKNTPLLLTGVSEPASWTLEPRDLRSRLGAIPVVRLGPADDITLDLRLTAACKHRYMKLPPETSRYIVKRLDADYDIIPRLVDELAAAADGKALTRAVARKALDALGRAGFVTRDIPGEDT
ncbi:MAG: DNA replication ATPase [Pseudomonadota bacterium]